MVLDSSALVALILREDEEPRLIRALDGAGAVYVGAPTVVETLMVLSSRMGMDATARLSAVLLASDAVVVPFTEDPAKRAHEAFMNFGKGRHRAGLNYGDCMAYAIAKVAGLPLLYVGDDFAQTDVMAA